MTNSGAGIAPDEPHVRLNENMKIQLTRDSVCAGDDVDAPHFGKITVPDNATVEEIVLRIAKSDYLAMISGGMATWSIASNIPIAVIAQQWDKPKMLCSIPYRLDKLDFKDGVMGCHINYHAQQDPEIVVEVLRRLRLKTIEPLPAPRTRSPERRGEP